MSTHIYLQVFGLEWWIDLVPIITVFFVDRQPYANFAAVPAHHRNGVSWRATATRAATSASRDHKTTQNSSGAQSEKEKLTLIV